jgi:hypothetical protein
VRCDQTPPAQAGGDHAVNPLRQPEERPIIKRGHGLHELDGGAGMPLFGFSEDGHRRPSSRRDAGGRLCGGHAPSQSNSHYPFVHCSVRRWIVIGVAWPHK